MKKSKQLIGLGIVELKSGKIIGKINGTIFSPLSNKILGFKIDRGKWIKSDKILSATNVKHVGSDMITIDKIDGINSMDQYPQFKDAMKEMNRIFGLKVITVSGEELGYIEDIIIDEMKLSIEGYVLTDGIVEDIIKGKTVIPFSHETIFGEDVVVINNSQRRFILKNEISLKKVFKSGRRLKS